MQSYGRNLLVQMFKKVSSGFRKLSSKVDDTFRLDSADILFKTVGSAFSDAGITISTPNIYYEMKEMKRRSSTEWSCYCDATANNNSKTPKNLGSIAAFLVQKGVPYEAVIGAVQGMVVIEDTERIAFVKGAEMCKFRGIKSATLFTDNKPYRLVINLRRSRNMQSLHNDLHADEVYMVKLLKARGWQVKWIPGEKNGPADYLSRYGKCFMPPQVVTKRIVRAADVTVLKRFFFKKKNHDISF